MDNKFVNIVKHGTYFSPANKHYGGNGTVVCDRCAKTNLKICIGYGSDDMCLECVSVVSNKMQCLSVDSDKTQFVAPPPQMDDVRVTMIQSMYRNNSDRFNTEGLTRMARNMFTNRDKDKIMTKMRQDLFF